MGRVECGGKIGLSKVSDQCSQRQGLLVAVERETSENRPCAGEIGVVVMVGLRLLRPRKCLGDSPEMPGRQLGTEVNGQENWLGQHSRSHQDRHPGSPLETEGRPLRRLY